MDEVLALQQELAAAQLTSTSQRLSERNCVELVMKLQSLNLVEVIFTRSGREYLTPTQLEREIEDELQTRGGRVNVTDLPDALNVALSHIEAALPKLTAKQHVRLVRGEVITDDYLRTLVSDVDHALNASNTGTDSLASVATRHALPVDLVRDTLSSSPALSAHFDRNSGTLTSATAAARHRAQARGLLRATATPTLLTELATDADIPLPILRAVVDQLLADGLLRGTIEGIASRATFVPEEFVFAAANNLVADYSANSYLRLDAIARMHVPNIKTFVDKHFPSSILLSDCVVQLVLKETLATTAMEALAAGSWLDILSAMPAGFPDGDIASFVSLVTEGLEMTEVSDPSISENSVKLNGTAKSKRKGRTAAGKNSKTGKPNVLFADQFIVSTDAVKLIEGRVVSHATEQAAEHAKEMAAKMERVGGQSETSTPAPAKTEPEEGGKKGKGKGRRRAGGKEKGGGGKGATNVNSDNSANVSVQSSISVPSLDDAIELILADDTCSKLIDSDFLEQSAAGEEMLQAVVEKIFGKAQLHSLYTTKAAEAVETLQREQIQARKEAERALLTDLQLAELFAKTADNLPDEALVSAVRTHILDTKCVDIVCRVVHAAGQSTGVVLAGSARAHELPSKREKLAVVRSACGDLAPSVAAKLRELISTASGKDGATVEQFLEEYDGAVMMIDLPERRPHDKKSERAMLASLRAELVASFDEYGLSEAVALKTAVLLTHAKSSGGSVVDFADEDCGKVCEVVEENAKPAEVGELLKSLRSLLEAHQADSPANATGLSPEFAEKLAELREYIG